MLRRCQIEQLQATYKLKKEQVDELTIRAGSKALCTQLGTTAMPLEVGMRVAPGHHSGQDRPTQPAEGHA